MVPNRLTELFCPAESTVVLTKNTGNKLGVGQTGAFVLTCCNERSATVLLCYAKPWQELERCSPDPLWLGRGSGDFH